MNNNILLISAIIMVGVLMGVVIPKASCKGVVVFDIDNTVLCNGSLLGSSQCNHYPWAQWPCSNAETIHLATDIQAPGQPVFEGRCVKNELNDGINLDCTIHNSNSGYPNAVNCSSTLNPTTDKPDGVDCGARDRAMKFISTLRDKGYAVAINTARFQEGIASAIPYLLYIGFAKDELQSLEDGGIIVYNKSRAFEYVTQAKQKAINMISIAKKFNLPRNKLILIDDQMINCKAVRDMGFKAYNVSTTFGQTYGWSYDSIIYGQSTADSTSQCGITEKQIQEIFNMI
jgi:hypothetical protein